MIRRYGVVGLMAAALLAAPAFAQRGTLKEAFLDPLLAASCPEGVEKTEPEGIPLAAKKVALQGINPSRKTIGALTLLGGFHLTSTDTRFGGLSGIEVMDDGSLLAVSDTGEFVWLALAEDGVTPVAARMARMRDEKGDKLGARAGADAEGLALQDGVALVSFEGAHRVMAYDVGKCGAAARAAPVVRTLDFERALAVTDTAISGNEGAEALALAPGWFMFVGLETQAGKSSAVTARAIERLPEFDIRIAQGAPELVGMDILPDGDRLRVFSLHRSSNPMASKAIMIVETVFEETFDQSRLPASRMSELQERARIGFKPVSARVLAEMSLFVTIDNFEGIAAREMPDGSVRLYVVSDNNFAARQRTLLMVYEVGKRS